MDLVGWFLWALCVVLDSACRGTAGRQTNSGVDFHWTTIVNGSDPVGISVPKTWTPAIWKGVEACLLF